LIKEDKIDPQYSPGIIEVDLFSDGVDSPDHPEAVNFKRLLEDVAAEFNCELISFEIDHGTVCFSFDSDELTANILSIINQPA